MAGLKQAKNLLIHCVQPVCLKVKSTRRKHPAATDRYSSTGNPHFTWISWAARSGPRVGGGTWAVSKVALAMFLDEDSKALRAYHAGDRASYIVMHYFRRAIPAWWWPTMIDPIEAGTVCLAP